MNELRLRFARTEAKSGDGRSVPAYTVQVVPGSGSPGEPIPFTPSLTGADYEDLRWYLEEFMDLPDGGSVTRAQRVEASLAQ